MATVGKCRHCGREPVARNVRTCPHCHGKFPNSSIFVRACDRGVVIGGLLGLVAGVIWGLAVVGGVGGVVVGVIVGILGGLLVGLMGGMVYGAVASVIGGE